MQNALQAEDAAMRTPNKAAGLFAGAWQQTPRAQAGSATGGNRAQLAPPTKMAAASPVFDALDSPGLAGTPQPGGSGSLGKARPRTLGMIDEHTEQRRQQQQADEWEGRLAQKLAGAVGTQVRPGTQTLDLWPWHNSFATIGPGSNSWFTRSWTTRQRSCVRCCCHSSPSSSSSSAPPWPRSAGSSVRRPGRSLRCCRSTPSCTAWK